MGDLKTNVSGIGSYLARHRLAVPDYQRSYSWSAEDEVREFWDDIKKAMDSDQDEYFLGAVVVVSGGDDVREQVIDGQQRLATASILYAALRDIYGSRSDERAGEIQGEVLGKKDRATRRVTQFLTLNAEDNDFFRQLTLTPANERELKASVKSHERLEAAYDFMHGKLTESIAALGPDDWPTPLIAWDLYLMNRAMIIDVSVPNEARGFVIFETLNDRGLSLSTADLLKNHLLGTADERIEEAKTQWTKAVVPFATPDSELDLEVFLRHFWASKKGVVRVKDLFWQMKSEVNTPDEAVALAYDLAEASRLWCAMFERDSEVWHEYSQNAAEALDTLRNLKVEQCRPLLLSALRHLPVEETTRLLALVVNWSVRWMVVGGGSAGTTERLYAETAKKVSDGTLRTAEDVVAAFDAVPGNLAFEGAFRELRVYRGWLARYYLQALERQAMGTDEPELVPNRNVEEVNLEHVLPKNPDVADWPSFSSEEVDLYISSIGNLCLLKKSHNDALGNRPFSEKKAVLAASDLVLTKEVGERDDWNPVAVVDRASVLARTAPAVWPKS